MHSNIYKKNITRMEGFTLGELLIVVGIIGVLVAVSIPIFTSQLSKARIATDQANVRSAKAAAAAEYMSDGETGKREYLYDGGRVISVTASNVSEISQITSSKGYGKASKEENKQNEKTKEYPTGASGTPKGNYIEITVDENSNPQIQASWVSSAGASGLATGNYVFTGALTKDSIAKQIEEMGVEAKDITTFKAAEGSTINETVSSGKNENGVLTNLFSDLPNLKYIDLSGATLSSGNINLFRNIDSVQEIKLPNCNSNYDIRGIWYYAGGERLDLPRTDSGANAGKDSRVTTGHNGATIYRSQAAARAAVTSSAQQN